MSRHIALATEPQTTTPMSSPACLKLIDRCTDEAGTLTIDDRMALSDDQRQELVEFIANVSASMLDDRPDRPDRMTPVAEILATYGSQAGAEGTGRARGGVYAKALAGMPGWAIKVACDDFLEGKLVDVSPKYAPSPTELRIAADRHVSRLRADAYRARQLLKAKPVHYVTDKEREAVKARIAGLAADLRRTNGQAA